jgi:hypothetical protein
MEQKSIYSIGLLFVLIAGIFLISGCTSLPPSKFVGNWIAQGPLGLNAQITFTDGSNAIFSDPLDGATAITYEVLNETHIKLTTIKGESQIIEYKFNGDNILTLYLTSDGMTFQRVK